MKVLFIAAVTLGLVSATRAHAQSTGYSECDEYIRMVTACADAKMPPASRADTRQQLLHFRGLLATPLGAAVAAKCGENIRLELEQDRYGCYADRAAAAGIRNACTLLTGEDLQIALNVTVGPPLPGHSSCRYQVLNRQIGTVTVTVRRTGGREQMSAWRAGAAGVRQDTKAGDSETLPHVADDALFVSAGLMPMLAVREGDTFVSIEAVGTREQLVFLARQALARVR